MRRLLLSLLLLPLPMASQVKILMPVVVKDAAGTPVTDLKVSDFSICGPKSVSTDRMWLVPPQTVSNEDTRTPIVVVYDGVNASDQNARTNAIRSFLSLVAKGRAPVTFFISTASSLQLIYDTTTPPEVLSSALALTENPNGTSTDSKVEQQAEKLRLLSASSHVFSIDRLLNQTNSLMRVADLLPRTDKRKAILWLVSETYLRGNDPMYEVMVEKLNAAHISVYPALFESKDISSDNPNYHWFHEQRLADCTGGLNLTKNSIWDAMQAMLADFGSYYVLAVAVPAPKETDWIPIKVKVNRPGLTVRAAPGFVGLKLKPLKTP